MCYCTFLVFGEASPSSTQVTSGVSRAANRVMHNVSEFGLFFCDSRWFNTATDTTSACDCTDSDYDYDNKYQQQCTVV